MKTFTPLSFLASLGAGGLAVAFFAFFNYVIPHGPGLVKIAQVHAQLDAYPDLLIYGFEALATLFILIHLYLSFKLFPKLFAWMKTDLYREMRQDPLRNAALLAPFISITMTMNVLIGPVRYFFPVLSDNLQALMLPGLIFWLLLWVLIMRVEISYLGLAFRRGFDLKEINFGWLLHPFSLAMLTVTGTGLAAMAQNYGIATTAAFFSLVSGSLSVFLFTIKTIALFSAHFAKDRLPDKNFLPSILVIVPHITLYAISLFRLGHYLERQQGAHLDTYFLVVMALALAFETWYLAFGVSLLRDYFRQYFFREFHASQWALICPFVAYGVLASFVYPLGLSHPLFAAAIVVVLLLTSIIYLFVLYKQYRCQQQAAGRVLVGRGIACS